MIKGSDKITAGIQMGKRYKTPLGHAIDRRREREGAQMLTKNNRDLMKQVEKTIKERNERSNRK